MSITYTARSWNLELDGLTKEQLEQHYKLYQGYVTNTNALNQRLAELMKANEGTTPMAGEVRRRLGFEYNGMRLHEYYFDNLGGKDALGANTDLMKKINEQWGSFEVFMTEFKAVAMMRGIGWVILYQDPVGGALQIFWVSDHENGHPAGFNPLVVLDLWEHAFTVDYKPTERAKYLEAFFKNLNWHVLAGRVVQPRAMASAR
jgi:superoxide dismutase, Fe-Mn family